MVNKENTRVFLLIYDLVNTVILIQARKKDGQEGLVPENYIHVYSEEQEDRNEMNVDGDMSQQPSAPPSAGYGTTPHSAGWDSTQVNAAWESTPSTVAQYGLLFINLFILSYLCINKFVLI